MRGVYVLFACSLGWLDVSDADADPFVEAAAGVAVPIAEAPLDFEFAASPTISARTGWRAGELARVEAAVAYTWLQGERVDHDRTRILVGGRVGHPIGARADVFARLAVGAERLQLHALTGRIPGETLVEVVAATRDGYAVDIGSGARVRFDPVDIGIQAAFALGFFDEGRGDHHVEVLFTVGADL